MILSEIDALAAQGFQGVFGATSCGVKVLPLNQENVGCAFSHLEGLVGVSSVDKVLFLGTCHPQIANACKNTFLRLSIDYTYKPE